MDRLECKKMEGLGKMEMEGGEGKERIERRVKYMERKIEMCEREDRKENMIIKGIEVKNERRREAVQEVLGILGVQVKVGEVRRIGGEIGKVKSMEMVLVRLESEKQKREVLREKRKLKERKG